MKREDELRNAVVWCRENNARGWSAVKSGLFPLIKDCRTINKRLDGEIRTGHEREYCSILTNDEEISIVRFLKNKNRCFQGLNKKKTEEIILNVLRLRDHYNRKFKGGRGFIKLSNNAMHALSSNSLGRAFWERWDAKHPSLVKKRQGTISIKRAMSCTREMACEHLDGLAAELENANILCNGKQLEPGVWSGTVDTSRIFNNDETPQFVNYGVDGTPSGLVYAEKGSEARKLLQENRECVSIDPFVSLSGEVAICHVIFSAVGITSQMAPPEAVAGIKNLLISTTENGFQTHSSLLDVYKFFNEYLIKNQIKKPVVLISDGHSSRFDEKVLRFMRENQIFLFLLPPDTTSVTQLLDQINQALHAQYRKTKDNMFLPCSSINREGFMQVLSEVWNTWTSPSMIINAAKRVGMAKTGLDVNWMQSEKFKQAEGCMQSEELEGNDTSSGENVLSTSLINSPVTARHGSAAYYKEKYINAVKVIDKLRKERVTLEEVPNLLHVPKIKPRKSRDKIRVTQVHGSLEGKKVLELVEEISKKKEEKELAQKASKDKKQKEIEAFYKCKDRCLCNDAGACIAQKLMQCPVCNDVLKSVCSKRACRSDLGEKPEMIKPACLKGRKKKKMVKRKLFAYADSSDCESDDQEVEYIASLINIEDDTSFDEPSQSEAREKDTTRDTTVFKMGDYVQVISGNYKGCYATVLGEGYGDEIELNYFEKKRKWWDLKRNAKDSREVEELKHAQYIVDDAGHFHFIES